MARYLVCLDAVPAADTSTCADARFIDQAGWHDYLPTMEQANTVGPAFAFTLFLIAAAIRTFKPQRL